ncbi:ABC transporter substrate-binding protein [Streptomyces sp. NBC_01320]|uniref:ABC transporter substrate-binding protein n=1 Tax=Streptomyces sp. NBC_01320 TaxID=2903824 RepID=UPI002E12A7A2|nr:ABC transporter substrate-binding protein [Streptomyces sp. NBC_01320]
MRSAVAVVTTVAASAALAGCGGSGGSTASDSDQKVIRLGQTTHLSGPAGAFGKSFSEGQQAVFKAVNDAGGVNGRKIELTVLDDGLDVARAVQNVRTLIGKKSVAIVGVSGAGSIEAMVPILNQAKIPLLFPSKSTASFANKVVPYAFAGIPAYPDQAHAVVGAAFKKSGPGSVFLVQTASDQSKANLARVKKAVADGGGTLAGEVIVPFGADVSPFALRVAKQRTDYVLFTSGPSETTKVVQHLAKENRLPRRGILGLTTLPGDTFAQGTPTSAQRLVYTLAATKPPTDPSAKECKDALAKYYPDTKPDYVTTFGCMDAQMVVAGLKAAGDDVTGPGIVKALESLKESQASPLIPPVSFSSTSHVGLTSLPVVTVKDGEFVSAGTVPVPVGS